MMDAPTKAQEIKAFLSAIFAAITVFIGWTGWLFVMWVLAMLIDWRLGVRYAKLNGEYSSDIARKGRWHKISSFYVALVAGGLDLTIQLTARLGMGFQLPWKGVILLPVVITWYILSEAGSIVENSAKLGAPVPNWLRKGIQEAQHKVDEQQSGHPPDTGWETEHSASEDAEE